MANQKILVEDLENAENIPEEEIVEYARQIGIDVENEEHLMWIAYDGIQAPVPHPWCPVEDEKGNIYYFNQRTGESMWAHPSDAHYCSLVIEEREFHLRNKSLTTTCSDPGFESKMPLEAIYDIKDASRFNKNPLPMLSSLADAPPLSSGGNKTLASLSKDTTKTLFSGKNASLGKLDHTLDSHKLAPMKLDSLNKSQSSALDHLTSKSSVFPKGSMVKNVKKGKLENVSKSKKKELEFTSASQRIVKFDLDDNSEEGSHYSYEETDYEGEDFPDVEDMILDRFGILSASQLSPGNSADGSPEPLDVNSLVNLKMKLNDNSLRAPHPYLKGKGKVILNDDEISVSSNSKKVERKQEQSPLKSVKSSESKNFSLVENVRLEIEPTESLKSHKSLDADQAGKQKAAHSKGGVNERDKMAVTEEQSAVLENIVQEWKIKQDELAKEEKSKFDRMKEEWDLKLKEEQDKMQEENENKIRELREKMAAEVEMEKSALKLSLDNLKSSNAENFQEEQKKSEAGLSELLEALQKEIEEKKQKMERELSEQKAALDAEHQKNLEEMKATHNAEFKDLKDEIQTEGEQLKVSEETENLKLELKEIKDLIEKEQQKLVELQKEITVLGEQKKSIQKEHADLKGTLKEDGRALKDLKEEKRLIQRDVEELQEEAEKLENDLDMLRGEKTSMFNELTSLKDEINKEKSAVLGLRKEKGELGKKSFEKLEKSVQVGPIFENKQSSTELTYNDESCQVELIKDTVKSHREGDKEYAPQHINVFFSAGETSTTENPGDKNISESQVQKMTAETNSYPQADRVKHSGEITSSQQIEQMENVESLPPPSSVLSEEKSTIHHKDMEEFTQKIMFQFDARMNVIEEYVKSLEERLNTSHDNETSIPGVKSNRIYASDNSPPNIYTTLDNKAQHVDNAQQPISTGVPQVPFPLYAAAGNHTSTPVYLPTTSGKSCYCELGDSCEILLGLKHSLHHLQQQVHQQFVPPWTNYPPQKRFHSSSALGQDSQAGNFRSELKDLRDRHHSTLLRFQVEQKMAEQSSAVLSQQPGTSRNTSESRNKDQSNFEEFSTYYNNWMPNSTTVYSANDDPIIRAREIVRREQERARSQSLHFARHPPPLYESYSFQASHSGSQVPNSSSNHPFPVSAQIPPLESSVSAGFGMHFQQIRPEIVSEHEIKTDLEAWLARIQNMHQRIRRHDRL